MRNDTKTIIKIEMNNVDHANHLVDALEAFFTESDMGGDCYLSFFDGYSYMRNKGFIGHDVRKPKISISYEEDTKHIKKVCDNLTFHTGFGIDFDGEKFIAADEEKGTP